MSKTIAFLSAYFDDKGEVLFCTRAVDLTKFDTKEMLDLYKIDRVKLVELTVQEYDE